MIDSNTIPTAVRYERGYPTSACKPHRLRFSDGNSYVVKFQGNPLGAAALVREHLALGIGKAAGFSLPSGGIVNVDAAFIANSEQLAGLTPGLQFGSRVVSDSPCIFDSYFIDQISNRHELAQIIVLDTFLCNADRHEANILLVADGRAAEARKQMWKFFMIDHSHLFECLPFSSESFAELLAGEKCYCNAISIGEACENDTQLDLAMTAAESLSDEEISLICDGVPDDWGVSAHDRDHLKSALRARRDSLREIIVLAE